MSHNGFWRGTLVAAGFAILSQSAAVSAQDRIIDRGVRESPRLEDRTPIDYDSTAHQRNNALLGVGGPGPTPKWYRFVVSTAGASADGANVYGATFGFINKTLGPVPFQLRGGYRRLDVDGPDDHNRTSVNGKIILAPLAAAISKSTSLALIGDFTRTSDVARRYEATLSGEQALTPKFAVGLNGSYVTRDPEVGATQEAWIGSTGVTYSITDRTDFSIDYQGDNKIDDEDDYSFTVTQLLSNPVQIRRASLVFGAGKHRTVFATLVFVF